MAVTLMPFSRPEQELFAHLRSFESYQSQKSPTTLKNILGSETCEQYLTSEIQSILAGNTVDSMTEKYSKRDSGLIPHRGLPDEIPVQEQLPTSAHHRRRPTSRGYHLRSRIATRRASQESSNPLTDPWQRATEQNNRSRTHNADKTSRSDIERRYSSLIDVDPGESSSARERAEPSSIPEESPFRNTIVQQPSFSTDTSSHETTLKSEVSSSHDPQTRMTKSLQPILRPSATGGRSYKQRPSNRVSFSGEDQVVTYDQGDETPIKQARKEWKVDRLPRPVNWEEQLADLCMDDASAYDHHHHTEPLDKYPRSDDQHGQDRYPSLIYKRSGKPSGPRPAPASGLRREKSPVPRRAFPTHLPWEKPPPHKHRHVKSDCNHGFVDPMPCTCERPEKVFELTACRECEAKWRGDLRREDYNDERQRRWEERVTENWWNKLARKFTW